MLKSLFFGFLGLACTSLPVHAFTTYEMAAFAHQHVIEATFHDYEADLFPTEKDIDSFPDPLESTETNTEVLEEYYRSVAAAYRHWGEKKNQEARKLDTDTRLQAQNLHLSKFRHSKATKSGIVHPSFRDKAQMNKARYAHDEAQKCHVIASQSLKKAGFYEAMADTCAEITKEF